MVSSRDLRDHDGSPADPRSGDLRHLREQGLIETTRVPGYRDHAVSLTKDGRSLLESHRDLDRNHHQSFYAGLGRERELEHDLHVYRAYEQAEDRLLKHFEEALNEAEDPSVRSLLQSHFPQVRACHDEMRDLKRKLDA